MRNKPKPVDPLPPFASALADRRQKLEKSQGDLAELIDVSQAAVSGWESGEVLPRAARLPDIASAYDIPVARLRDLWMRSTARKAA
jgi:transcriptional regulator with XRE-family HTH domain